MIRASWIRAVALRLEKSSVGRRARRRSRTSLHRSARSCEILENRELLTTFTVNTTADTVDANPGNGVAADAQGKTSLRAAIMESNAENQAGVVKIVLGAGTYDLTIPPAGPDDASSGDLNITSQIQIVGAGAATTTINAQQLDRIFDVDPGASLNLSGVTLINGLDNTSTIGGGAIDVNGGTLTLSKDVFSSNQTSGSADDFGGGALAAHNSTVTITGSTFSNNSTTGTGGAIVTVKSVVMISSSVIEGNSAFEGGGISNRDGSQMTIKSSTISGNTGTHDAGGIDSEHATLTISNATNVLSNQTGGDGGGLFNYAGSADLRSSTFLGNTATGQGGGVENTGNSVNGPEPIGVLTAESDTFTQNTAAVGGGIDNKRDSQMTITGGKITQNEATNSGGGVSNTAENGFAPGQLTISGVTITGNSASSIGGGVFSTGSNTTIESSTKINSNSANEGGGISDVDGSQMTITGSTIASNISSTDGGGIDVEHATLSLSNSTVSSNQAATDGGGVFNYAATTDISGSTFKSNIAGRRGGGVENTGNSVLGPQPIGVLTVENSTFSTNSASVGGGLDNYRDSQMTISGSTITQNKASDSGGGFADSETEAFGPGSVSISTTTIANNTAVNGGGGILVEGSQLNVVTSTISGNKAATGGGLLSRNGSSTSLLNDTISNNTASTSPGGGIEAAGGSVSLGSVTVAYNSAPSGGGIDVAPEASVTLLNSLIAKNTAATNPDVQGVFDSLGTNLVGNVGTATGFGSTDLIGTSAHPLNAHIGTLANNGGSTKTIALLTGSPAINAANGGPLTDQRGVARFPPNGDGLPDIGAYELNDSAFASSGLLD